MLLQSYASVLIFIGLAIIFGAALVSAGRFISSYRPNKEKNSTYECGFEAFEDARVKFDVKYYLIAIIFILFDLEVAFLFPWALVYRKLGLYGFVVMSVFLTILIVGFVYIWKKGALEWE